MRKYKPAEAARILGVSTATVYRMIKRRSDSHCDGIENDDQGRIVLTDQGIEQLRKQLGETAGDAPATPITLIDSLRETIATQQRIIATHNENVHKKDDMISKLLESQQDMIRIQDESQKRHDTIIMTLTQQMRDQAKQLEDLREKKIAPDPLPETGPVVNLAAKRVSALAEGAGGEKKADPHPMETWSPLERMLVNFFQPWKLRRDYREKKAA